MTFMSILGPGFESDAKLSYPPMIVIFAIFAQVIIEDCFGSIKCIATSAVAILDGSAT